MASIKLSVVIPAYNEESNLKQGVLDRVTTYLDRQKYSWEVVIVDDGSKDETVKLVEQAIDKMPKFSLIKNPHGGKAITVMTGLLAAKGEIVLFTDMDQATPLNQVEKFLPKFDEGYDVVIGSRSGRQGEPPLRKLAAWGFSVVRNLILGLPFKDTQCGFKAFRQPAVSKVFPKLLSIWKERKAQGAAVNAGFDVEALLISKKVGFKIAEVRVDWHHVGSARVNIFRDGIEAIKDILRIRLNDLKGSYD